jgi:hypothetical protein
MAKLLNPNHPSDKEVKQENRIECQASFLRREKPRHERKGAQEAPNNGHDCRDELNNKVVQAESWSYQKENTEAQQGKHTVSQGTK